MYVQYKPLTYVAQKVQDKFGDEMAMFVMWGQ